MLKVFKKILATFYKKLKKTDENDSLEIDLDYFKIEKLDFSIFIQYLCQNTPENCHLLFTSRCKISDLAEQVKHLALDKLTYAEQYA